MARPKSHDPATRLAITLPKSIHRLVIATARAKKTTASALTLEAFREYFQSIARALDGGGK